MIDVRPAVFLTGILLAVLAAAMVVPALVDVLWGDRDWRGFLVAALITGFVGLGMALATRPEGPPRMSNRQAFLMITVAWLLVPLFGAFPFVLSDLQISFTDSYYEAMSGLSTTGATVITGLDDAPRGILLWRAILHWLGGIGIVIMAVVILPILRIGGMQLFKMESTDKTDKIKPRISQVARGIILVYSGMTVLCTFMLWVAGMDFFDSLCHAMSALATGGFSTSDASIAHWKSPTITWILTFFMTIGGMSLVLFITPPWRRNSPVWRDTQLRWYVFFLVFFSILLAGWQWVINDETLNDSIRHASFSVVSVVTTTGFASDDYNQWGGFPQVIFFLLAFVGGCTGSTTGGVKVFRWQVLFKMAGVHLKRLLHPHGIFMVDFNHQRISDAVVYSVLGFVAVYFLIFAVFSLLLSLTGLDFMTALTGSASALSNVGPGLGELIGPAGNFKTVPDAAKWLLSVEMMLGRLELFSVVVLFSRAFWRE